MKGRLLALLLGAAFFSGACVPLHGMESAESPAGQAPASATSTSCQQYSYDPSRTLALPLLMDMRAASTSLPGAGWYTNAFIQNNEDWPVPVRLTAWRRGSAVPSGCVEFEIGPNEFIVFSPDNPGLVGTIGIPAIATGDFEGSMTVESSHDVTAVVLLSNTPTGKMGRMGGTASAAYIGLKIGH